MRSRISAYSFVLLFTFLLFCVKAEAQGFATVDTRVLLMLHPLMADFDYSIGRFYRESTKNKNSYEVWLLMDNARKKTEPELEKIKKEISDLTQKQLEYETLLERNLNRFAIGDIEQLIARKKALQDVVKELSSKTPRDKNEQKRIETRLLNVKDTIAEIEDLLLDNEDEERKAKRLKSIEEIKENIKAVKEEIAKKEQERFEVGEKAFSMVYFTLKETNERIEKAKKEVFSLIEKAAKEGKFSVVLDTTFAMRSVKRKRRNNIISINDDSPDVVGASLFHYFSNLEDEPETIEHLKKNLGEEMAQLHFVAGHTIGMQSNLKQYLEFRNYLPETASSFSNGKVFLIGGSDITIAVARNMINKYKIPESTKELLIKTLREYVNYEIEPYLHEITY